MEHKSESLRKSFEKGVTLYFRAQYEEAANYLMEIASSYPRAYLFLALVENKRPGTVKKEYLLETSKKISILNTFLNTKDSRIIYENGLYNLASGHYEVAVQYFDVTIKAKNPGDPYAQYRLGFCYAQGKGVEKDLVKAAKYFYGAAVQGHGHATFFLSMCCLGNKKIAENYGPWFQWVVNQGNANQNAQFHVGFCHLTGKELVPDKKSEQSYKQAAKLFLPIIESDHITAQYLFAMSCYCDTSLVMDPAFSEFPGLSAFNNRTDKAYFLAERYARFAAKAGSRDAQYALAIFLLKGVGGRQDFEAAYFWFGKAASNGHEEAQNCLTSFAAEYAADFAFPAVKGSPEDNKVKAAIADFEELSKRLPETLDAYHEYIKVHLDAMFAFESNSKPVSSVTTTLPPVEELKSVQLPQSPPAESKTKPDSNISASFDENHSASSSLPPVQSQPTKPKKSVTFAEELTKVRIFNKDNDLDANESLLQEEVGMVKFETVSPKELAVFETLLLKQKEGLVESVSIHVPVLDNQQAPSDLPPSTTSEPLPTSGGEKTYASSESSSSVTTSTVSEFDQGRFEEGMQAYDLEQYPTAFKIFQEAAEAKYPPAYVFLGVMYERGFGVTADAKKPGAYYEKARQYFTTFFSKPGNECYLGRLYQSAIKPRDKKKAAHYYEIAANNKEQYGQMQYRAQYALGGYYSSIGDNVSARKWYEKADLEGNNAAAQYELGLASYNEYHTETSKELKAKHYANTVALLQKSADQGHVGAQYCLAEFLYEIESNKKDVSKQDYSQVIKYLNLAVLHEHTEAQFLLGQCYLKGRGVLVNYSIAAELLGKAKNKGFEAADTALKLCKVKIEEYEQPKAKKDGEAKKASSAVLVGSLSKLFQSVSGQQTLTREKKAKAKKAEARKAKKTKAEEINTQPAPNVGFFSNSSSSSSSEISGATTSSHLASDGIRKKIQEACDTPLDLGSVSSAASTSSSSSNK